MYKDDHEAMLARAESATREAEQLRRENLEMRKAAANRGMITRAQSTTISMLPQVVYGPLDVRSLPLEERAYLAQHALKPFPVWAVAILHLITFGLFPVIHFGLMHDRLPRAAHDDPSAGKAIGFQFIPYFNLYWIFFSSLRLCDRLTFQLKLRGEEATAPRGLTMASAICSVIPYVNLIVAYPILWTINVCRLQSTVNRIAAMPPTEWDASLPGDPRAHALLEAMNPSSVR